ncbi:MAG TPA: ABC transporter permease [Streptosporangiaceae bacterium]|nr:ABC transporter permease [Streptosporangiaceae bacterium]
MSSAVVSASRLGVTRGLLEFKQTLVTPAELFWTLLINVGYVLVLYFQRNRSVEGSSLALLTLPSILGMAVAFGGAQGATNVLATHREDGTLLRAKAIPNGMVGYLVAQLVVISLTTVFGIVVVLVPGLFLIGGFPSAGAGDWLLVLGVLVLGLLATLPWGMIIGSFVKSAAAGFGLTFLPLCGIVAISGIFYPITALAGWLQGVAQAFPIYWLGLGMRAALLPDSAVAAEIGQSWRQVPMIGVLAVWSLVGLSIAPSVLRRMARKESGATMQERKERALHRGY